MEICPIISQKTKRRFFFLSLLLLLLLLLLTTVPFTCMKVRERTCIACVPPAANMTSAQIDHVLPSRSDTLSSGLVGKPGSIKGSEAGG